MNCSRAAFRVGHIPGSDAATGLQMIVTEEGLENLVRMSTDAFHKMRASLTEERSNPDLLPEDGTAVALTDPRHALAIAEQLDITSVPAGLAGREAQFHLDSAWAHTQLGEDPSAVIHLLDTERVAPELVRANPNARTLIADLLSCERRRVVPGLRGLSVRAGVAA